MVGERSVVVSDKIEIVSLAEVGTVFLLFLTRRNGS